MKCAMLLALGPLLLSSCSSLSGHIVTDSKDYNRSLDEIENQQLLLNIIRASNRLPMRMTSVSSIGGALSTNGNFETSEHKVGDSLSKLSLTLSGGIKSSPTFSVTNLHTQEFMNGFLSPIHEDTFKRYW